MKRTVWDRLDGAATMEGSTWEGDDAPTNVAPPAFVKEKTHANAAGGSGSGFLKGVLVGVGVSAAFVGIFGIAAIAVAAAVFGVPSLPASVPATITRADDVTAAPVRAAVPAPEIEEPVVAAPATPIATPEVVKVVVPVATPVLAKVVEKKIEPVAPRTEPRPAAKSVARAKPVVETRRAPAPVVAAPAPAPETARAFEPEETLADLTSAPAPLPAPEVKRPSREELLQLALAAKQVATPAPTPAPIAKAKPAPAPRWEDADEKPAAAASDEKWFPVDDTDESSASTDSGSGDLDDVLAK